MTDTLTRERREELAEAIRPDGVIDRTNCYSIILSGASITDLLTALRRLGEIEGKLSPAPWDDPEAVVDCDAENRCVTLTFASDAGFAAMDRLVSTEGAAP